MLYFGKRALYVRLPSEQEDAVCHRIKIDGVHKDVFAFHDKFVFSAARDGIKQVSADYEDRFQQEQDVFEKRFEVCRKEALTSIYIRKCDVSLQELFERAAILHPPPMIVVPAIIPPSQPFVSVVFDGIITTGSTKRPRFDFRFAARKVIKTNLDEQDDVAMEPGIDVY